MADDEAPKPLFATPTPSAASVPHLITFFDAELLQAIVRINGAKLGVWNVPAPFGEDDRYEPYREDAPLAAWAMALNQQGLLNLDTNASGLIYGNETIIVDSTTDEAVLAECEKACGEEGYENLADFPGLLAKINWALVPIGQEHDHVLFVAGQAKMDYFELLWQWCHARGRTVSTIALDGGKLALKAYPAPEEARQQAAVEQAHQYLTRLAQFGIGPQEAVAHLAELIGRLPKA